MPNCTSCGSSIPEGQGSSCSMCYGDPDHGRDGYYAKWLQDQYEDALAKEQQRQAEIADYERNQLL